MIVPIRLPHYTRVAKPMSSKRAIRQEHLGCGDTVAPTGRSAPRPIHRSFASRLFGVDAVAHRRRAALVGAEVGGFAAVAVREVGDGDTGRGAGAVRSELEAAGAR